MPDPSIPEMPLTTGWRIDIQNPSDDEIAKTIQDMPGGENSFVILRKDTDNFIQVAGHKESGYLLEYWENKQGYVCTIANLSMDGASL